MGGEESMHTVIRFVNRQEFRGNNEMGKKEAKDEMRVYTKKTTEKVNKRKNRQRWERCEGGKGKNADGQSKKLNI